MSEALRIGVVGDFNPDFVSHVKIAESIDHAATHLRTPTHVEWVPTPQVAGGNAGQVLGGFDGVFLAPGSPYSSFDGAIAAARFSRARRWPFFGSCAGFQHALIEYARNVLGVEDAHSAEYDTHSKNIVVVPVSCPAPGRAPDGPKLSGTADCPENTIQILPGTRAFRIYQRETIREEYFCNYEANLAFQARLEEAGLRISGVGPRGEARIVEVGAHPFFLATLFQPMRASTPGKPHPLLVGFLLAAAQFHRERGSGSSSVSGIQPRP